MSESTDFLYPFIDAAETDSAALLLDLAASARAKAAESLELQEASLEQWGPEIAVAAHAMAQRFLLGGRLYTFGNGGSSTDAATLAALFAAPASGRPLPAMCLAADQAVLTALGNDVGFELIFPRLVSAYARPVDSAIARSTSGSSDDLMRGLSEAKRRGLLTLGFAGDDGGLMATSTDVDHCITVRSHSIHRIQESQALLGYALWSQTQASYDAAQLSTAGGPS